MSVERLKQKIHAFIDETGDEELLNVVSEAITTY